MKYRRFAAIARKEFLHIVRDSRSLAMALALPVLMLVLFGYALTLDVDRIPLVVLDQDQTPQSREVISRFSGSRYFEVVAKAESYSDVQVLINKGTCLAALVVAPDFARDLSRGEQSPVQLIIDGTDSNTASIALGYAQGIVTRLSEDFRNQLLSRQVGRALKTPVELRTRIWYNSALRSRDYIVPGLIAVVLMIIASLLTSLTIAREWEMGTMEQLLSTPVRPLELVLGKMSAYFLLGTADTIVAIVLGVVVFGVPLRGNILLLAGSCFLFLVGALCWGIFLSATVRSQLLAYQMGMISSFLPAFLLSGFIFSIANMPIPVQAVTYIVPARYFISILRGIFLKGIGLEALVGQFLFLLGFAVLVVILATRKMKGKVA